MVYFGVVVNGEFQGFDEKCNLQTVWFLALETVVNGSCHAPSHKEGHG
jgi:hypothetical protein